MSTLFICLSACDCVGILGVCVLFLDTFCKLDILMTLLNIIILPSIRPQSTAFLSATTTTTTSYFVLKKTTKSPKTNCKPSLCIILI